jgi:hypothetical protein
MADMSRFARREGHEVVAELKRIAKKAAVYFYETGQRYTFGDLGTNIANYAMAESNADYRRKVRTKVKAAGKHKAALGHVLGGHAFGYRNVDVMTGKTDASGRPVRSHVTRKVHEPEAVIVREIFERYAFGQGLKKIAYALNDKGAVTPRPRNADAKSCWRPSNVRSILLNPLYRGIARWNRLCQHDDDGPIPAVVNPETEHVTFYNPDWRIIDDATAEAVDSRFREPTRNRFGDSSGPRPGAQARYLLSGGMLLCHECGGRFEARNGRHYVCATRRDAGTSVCTNSTAFRIEVLDEIVLRLLDGQVLHPRFVGQVLSLACGTQSTDSTRKSLEAQIADLTSKIGKLAALAETLDDSSVSEVADRLKERVAERETLRRRLATLAEPIDRGKLKAALGQRITDWRARLRSDFREEARFVVQQLIGPLTLFEDYPSADLNAGRGKENIEFSDCGFRAVITPLGLLNGLPAGGRALSVVAGARSRLYRRRCPS